MVTDIAYSSQLRTLGARGGVLDWNTARKLAWKILNELGMYRVGIGWVLCPFPCDVFAAFPSRTPPLAPSVSSLEVGGSMEEATGDDPGPDDEVEEPRRQGDWS